jgi:hypothetical protein
VIGHHAEVDDLDPAVGFVATHQPDKSLLLRRIQNKTSVNDARNTVIVSRLRLRFPFQTRPPHVPSTEIAQVVDLENCLSPFFTFFAVLENCLSLSPHFFRVHLRERNVSCYAPCNGLWSGMLQTVEAEIDEHKFGS